MMISKQPHIQAFVWIWLPGESEPVVTGKLTLEGKNLLFNYGKSYLNRANAIAIYDQELPLKPGVHALFAGLSMPNCIRDAVPDAWGRRVLINRLLGLKGEQAGNTSQLDELSYLL